MDAVNEHTQTAGDGRALDLTHHTRHRVFLCIESLAVCRMLLLTYCCRCSLVFMCYHINGYMCDYFALVGVKSSVMSTSVCLSTCISQKPHVQT